MHLSLRSQVPGTLARFFAGRTDVVLLKLDPARLTAEVRFEEGEPGELFPHLYGPLPVESVMASGPVEDVLGT